MEDIKETVYKISGKELLGKYGDGKELLNKITDFDEEGNERNNWVSVTLCEVWVTDGPNNCQIHAKIDDNGDVEVSSYIISREKYSKWKVYKGNKKRLDLFLEVFKGKLRLKKIVADRHIDIRMTYKLYRELSDNADKTGKKLSEYCRELLEGKKPRAALTPDEASGMKELISLRTDIHRFSAAIKGQLGKMTKEERLNYIIEGQSMQWWRRYIFQALQRLDQLINKEI